MYCESDTANVPTGGTKQKSNSSTPSTVASTEGHCPNRAATIATDSK